VKACQKNKKIKIQAKLWCLVEKVQPTSQTRLMNFPPEFCFAARAGENFMQKRKTQTPTKLQWSVENLRSA